MFEALSNALSGLNVASRKAANTANNVANVLTPGFKAGTVDAVEVSSGGATVASISKSTAGGSIITTSNPIDVAINGNGFLQVTLTNGGTGYTRAGNLKLDSGGRLVTTEGLPLNPAITVPAGTTELSIASGGEVSARVGGNVEPLGQIQLANFNNPSGLQALGGNLFQESGASGAPIPGNPGTGGAGELVPGAIEGSNVDIPTEMVDMITAKLAFKANINMIKTTDEMMGAILNIKA